MSRDIKLQKDGVIFVTKVADDSPPEAIEFAKQKLLMDASEHFGTDITLEPDLLKDTA